MLHVVRVEWTALGFHHESKDGLLLQQVRSLIVWAVVVLINQFIRRARENSKES